MRHRSRNHRARTKSIADVYVSSEQLLKTKEIREKKGQAGMILTHKNGKLTNFKFLSKEALESIKQSKSKGF